MKENCIIGPYSRQKHAQFDEVGLIFDFFETQAHQGTMIDVGAHLGHSFKPFADGEWTVHAIEPFPSHFNKLEQRWGQSGNVTLYQVAISNEASNQTPFYASHESDGINTLTPFLPTHRKVGNVSTASLACLMNTHSINEVDFLKVDTEGYDLMALEGFPWERTKPQVILCEFEDVKSEPIGYLTTDMADLLAKHGYNMLVSEWHPIARYGDCHDWHALSDYPCPLREQGSWGNLIAARDRKTYHSLRQLATAHISFSKPPRLAYRNFGSGQLMTNDALSGMRVCIFGAGALGRQVLRGLEQASCSVCGFADNDAQKQRLGFGDLPVLPPEKLAEHEFDLVVIASSSANAIYEQLNKAGVSKDKLVGLEPSGNTTTKKP